MVQTKPDLAAYDAATRASPSELVHELRDLLGLCLTAIIAGVHETRAVHEWADGTRPFHSPDALPRLRLAYQVARLNH